MNGKLAVLFGVTIIASAGLGYAAHHEMAGMMTPTSKIDWQPVAEDSPVHIAVLFGDPSTGENVRMFKLPPGTTVPVHMHTGDYHAVNVSGTWRHSFDGGEQLDLPPGSYVYQPGGGFHADACVGADECIIMAYQAVAADYIPKEQ